MSSSGESRSACNTCLKVLDSFQPTSSTADEITLGTWEDIVLRSKCNIHAQLFKRLFPDTVQWGPSEELSLFRNFHYPYVYLQRRKPDTGTNSVKSAPLLLLSTTNASPETLESEKLLDFDGINLQYIRSWLGFCNARHGAICNPILPGPFHDTRPMFLIDTVDKCLVPAGLDIGYTTLSYVMGTKPFFKTVQADLPRLLKPGALTSLPDNSPPIPDTVADAISLVQAVGERFLWNGSLCIVQDVPAIKAAEISKIAAIYANSSLTIVASQGNDAFFGLQSRQGASGSRNYNTDTIEFGPMFKVVRCETSPESVLEASAWSRRAWTFQEHLFARRLLIFGSGTAYWHCERSGGEESDQPESAVAGDSTSPFSEAKLLASSMVPNLRLLRSLITCINNKDLTHPGDIVNAFAGTASLLSRAFPGGLHFGLPLVLFDVALLWQPFGSSERRIAHVNFPGTDVPSWSWVGWAGQLQELSMCNGYDGIKRLPKPQKVVNFECLVPTVQWYSHSTRDKTGSSPIPRAWHAYRERFLMDRQRPLPEGWTRHDQISAVVDDEYEQLPMGYPKNNGRPEHFYRHPRYPDSEFWYPLPIPEVTDSIAPAFSARYISCRTQRAWLYHKGCFKSSLGVECRTLREFDGTWAGMMRTHEDSGNQNFMANEVFVLRGDNDPSHTEDVFSRSKVESGEGLKKEQNTAPITIPPQLELISISRASCYNTAEQQRPIADIIHEWHHPERPTDTEKYEYHNVIWIQWDDGVAYRRGLGRVERRIWERQKLEWIDVTLG